MTGVFLVFLSAAGFSAKAVLVKLAYGYGVDSVTLLALRMAFSFPFFAFTALWAGGAGMGRRAWLSAAGLGFMGYYLASFLDFLGLQYVSAGLERMILFLYPTLVVILSALMHRRGIGRRRIIALLASYLGIAVVFMNDASMIQKNLILGATLIFGGSLAFALYLIGSGNVIAKIGAMRFSAIAMSSACIASMVQFLLLRPIHALVLPRGAYEVILCMAIFSTVLPAFLLSAGIRRIGAEKSALVNAAGPVMTIFLAWKFLGEPVTWLQMLGTILVLAGVLIVSLEK